MREKNRRVPGARGFTAIEVVVTVVVLAILAAYAAPKLFGLKDQAKETEETLKIQDIASRHAKEMLEQGKRNGSLPTLGGIVGFRESVVAEEAPDTAPMLVDWAWNRGLLIMHSSMSLSLAGAMVIPGYISPSIFGEQHLKCRDAQSFANPLAMNGGYARRYIAPADSWDVYDGVYAESTNTSHPYYRLISYSSSQMGASEAVPVTEPAPKCALELEVMTFATPSPSYMYPQDPLFGNMRGIRTEYKLSGDTG